MAKETLLESDIDAGSKFIKALDKAGETINAALWLYYPDLAQWKLLLSSPKFERGKPTESYTKISQILSSNTEIGENISVADIKVLNKKDPLIKLLEGIVRTGNGVNRIRISSNVFNGIYVEDALLYRNT